MEEINIKRKLNRNNILKQPYAVDAIDVSEYSSHNVNINRLLDQIPGVRVRENGGFGSETAFSIHGISGKGIKFYLDGIPLDYLGGAFFIQNFPANNIDRVDVYKGVVPIQLGGDALGGAVNIISKAESSSYLNASYALGSFQTHRLSLAAMKKTNKDFVIQTSLFYNSSKNNYEVWGNGVEIPDEFGRPIPDFRAKRFNDDYKSFQGKLGLGWINKPWADKLLLNINLSGLERGVQHGRTMAYVYGKVRYKENGIMPSIQFTKSKLFDGKLDIDLYGLFSNVNATTTDTSSYKYNWSGQPLPTRSEGELNNIYSQKSIYHFYDNVHIWRANSTYRINETNRIKLAYNGQWLNRKGKDDMGNAEWTIPLVEPQKINKNFLGLSYELDHDKFSHIFSAKGFSYYAKTNAYIYSNSSQKEIIPRLEEGLNWGLSYAGKYTVSEELMLKTSAERTLRIPEAVELFGDGTTILNAPGLKPEQSLNINFSTHWEKNIRENDKLQIIGALFYRDTKNLIWLGEGDNLGTTRYENLNRIGGRGAEINVNYLWANTIQFSANYTFQDIRNKQRSNSAAPYNAKMKNMPRHLANASIRWKSNGRWIPTDKISAYFNAHFVPQYALYWPIFGNENKSNIPQQFVLDAGISYQITKPITVAIDCQNLTDKQVYDNFMLQKPGRFLSVKLQYNINTK